MRAKPPKSKSTRPAKFLDYENFPLLSLPQSVRVRIWNHLGFSHTRTLRLVCSQIKEDIDTVAGISSAIDSTFEDFSFHCKTAIRKVAIHELITPAYIEFLKYPLSLRELELRGEVSLKTFHYVIQSCPNLVKIFIIFNKFVIDHKALMFPLPLDIAQHPNRPLSQISSVKIISTTKKLSELLYVHKMTYGLISSLPREVNIASLTMLMSHRNPSVYFNELIMSTMLLVHKHAPVLRTLNLMFKDREVSSSSSDAPPAQNPPAQSNQPSGNAAKPETKASGGGGLFGFLWGSAPVQPQHKDVHKDVEPKTDTDTDNVVVAPEGEGEANITNDDSELVDTNERTREATRYLIEHPWPKAIWLQSLTLSVPYKIMEYILNLISQSTKLEFLSLESFGNSHPPNNWNLYKKFITQGNMRNLRTAAFHHISNEDSKGRTGPLNLRIFRQCKGLNKLTLLCERKDNFRKLCHATNVSSLPKSLREVHFERVLLFPCQVFRLIFCFNNMDQISISYWSVTDCQFSFLMGLLKWAIRMDMTDCQRVNLVDTKIRFKNNRKAVRKLQEALDISAKYQDFDETRLVIDTDIKKSSERNYAPRISIFKAAPIQARPRKIAKSRNSLSSTSSVTSVRSTIRISSARGSSTR